MQIKRLSPAGCEELYHTALPRDFLRQSSNPFRDTAPVGRGRLRAAAADRRRRCAAGLRVAGRAAGPADGAAGLLCRAV